MKQLFLLLTLLFTLFSTSSSVSAGGGRMCDPTIESCPALQISVTPTTLNQGNLVTVNWNSINNVPCVSYIRTYDNNGQLISNQMISKTSGSYTQQMFVTGPVTYSCQNSAGGTVVSNSVNVTVNPTPITGGITTTKTNLVYGESLTITWNSLNADKCWINGVPVAINGSRVEVPSVASYYLYCTNVGGNTLTKIVNLNITHGIIASMSASPATITAGQSTTLSWSSTNATSCTIDGVSIGTNSSKVVTPSATRYFTVMCSNPLGTVFGSVLVTVNQPTVTIPSFVATPATITAGQSTTLSWSSTNATSCTIDGVSVGTNSSKVVTPSATRWYTIVCGSVMQSVLVTVNQPAAATPVAPTMTLKADSPFVTRGGRTTIRWSTTSAATSCKTKWNGLTVPAIGSAVVVPTGTTLYTVECTYNNWPFPYSQSIYVMII